MAAPDLSALNDFLSGHPHIRHAAPGDHDYDALRVMYIVNDALRPAMIVRPQSADDVAGLVAVLTSHAIPFTVRSGGHDMFGRSLATNTVTIDMRDIAHVDVDRASLSARVGGGVIVSHLATKLGEHNVATACGTIPVVGFTGWATHGGYGILSPKFGLGVDQILGAKVVNAEGKIVDADERLLTGIRGGGGAFGVIVELTIRVYESGSVFGGMIMYNSEDLTATIRQFNDGYRKLYEEGLPAALGVHQAVMNAPQGGKGFGLFFLWNSADLDQGDVWLKKICALAPVAMHTVAKTTVADWLNLAGSMVGGSTFGTLVAVSFRSLTPKLVDVLAAYGEKLPSVPNTMFGIHELRDCPSTSTSEESGASPTSSLSTSSRSPPDSVFAARQPHYMLEIFPTASSADALGQSVQWATEFRDALLRADPANVLPTRYLPFAPPQAADMREIFQDRYQLMTELKREYDPHNVFNLALARL